MGARLEINGLDAYEHYGVTVEQYGYESVVQYPALKTVIFNSWAEEDGIEVDLSEPVLDSREFDLEFSRANTGLLDELLHLLATELYLEFNFIELGYCINLRLVSQGNITALKRLEKFSLRFAHDTPLENYTYAPPIPIGVKQIGYEIDGKLFSEYGISVVKGSDEEIAKSPAVKKNLLTNIDSRSGATYHGEKVVFQQKDVSLKCHISGTNKETFWINYLAFLHDLVQPEERMFFSDKIGEEYPCFYKSSAISKFDIIRGRIWCDFSVVLTFTSFRIGETDILLAGEDNYLILDEEGINLIDLK